MRHYVWIFVAVLALQLPARAISIVEVRKSLVRITNNAQEPNYLVPWNPGGVGGGTGAGMSLSGGRTSVGGVTGSGVFLKVACSRTSMRFSNACASTGA